MGSQAQEERIAIGWESTFFKIRLFLTYDFGLRILLAAFRKPHF